MLIYEPDQRFAQQNKPDGARYTGQKRQAHKGMRGRRQRPRKKKPVQRKPRTPRKVTSGDFEYYMR